MTSQIPMPLAVVPDLPQTEPDRTRPERGARLAYPQAASESVTADLAAEVIGLIEAGRLLGMGRTKAYRLAQAGAFPCRVLRIGGRYAVPVRGLRALLDHHDNNNDEGDGRDDVDRRGVTEEG